MHRLLRSSKRWSLSRVAPIRDHVADEPIAVGVFPCRNAQLGPAVDSGVFSRIVASRMPISCQFSLLLRQTDALRRKEVVCFTKKVDTIVLVFCIYSFRHCGKISWFALWACAEQSKISKSWELAGFASESAWIFWPHVRAKQEVNVFSTRTVLLQPTRRLLLLKTFLPQRQSYEDNLWRKLTSGNQFERRGWG